MSPVPVEAERVESEGGAENGDRPAPFGRTAVELLGAATGFLFVLYVIGGVVIAARLHALDLPISSTIALLSTATLVIVALQVVWLGLILGAILWAASELYHARRRRSNGGGEPPVRQSAGTARRSRAPQRSQKRARRNSRGRRDLLSRRAGWLAARADALLPGVILVVAVGLQIGLTPLSWFGRIALLVAGLGAVAAATWTFQADIKPRRRALVLLGLVTLLAGGLKAVDEYVPPTKLDAVSVLMKSGETVDGYHLADAKHSVLIVPNVLDRTVRQVSALPRSEVANISFSKSSEEIVGLHQKVQQPLIGRRKPVLSPQEGDPEEAMLRAMADIRTDRGWRYPPKTPDDSVRYLIERFDDFTDRPRDWYERGSARVPLRDILEDPQLYTGETVNTSGRVLRAHSTGVPESGSVSQFLLLTDVKASGEASCWFTRDENARPVRAGDRVRVRAAVAGWGTWTGRAGEKVPELVLICSTATDDLGSARLRPGAVRMKAGRRRSVRLSWRARDRQARVRRLAVHVYAGDSPGAQARITFKRTGKVRSRAASSRFIRIIRPRAQRGRLTARVVFRTPRRLASAGDFHLVVAVTDRHGRVQIEPEAGTLQVVG